MEREEIKAKVKELIAEVSCHDESEITDDANVKEDLELDSLDHIELVVKIEEEFGIEVPEEVSEKVMTANGFTDMVSEYLTKKP